MPLEVHVGDIVTTRKTHPCGSNQWAVYRIGADIGLKCRGCGRRIMLPRRQFERAVKSIDHTPESPEDTAPEA